MTTKTEEQGTGAFIVDEARGGRSRENVTIDGASALKPGQVMGIVTGTGNYAAYNDLLSDGTEVAAGIFYGAVDGMAGTTGVVIVRDAVVNKEELMWHSGVLTAHKTAAYAELTALGIIVRDAV